jgi:hypothetical protein
VVESPLIFKTKTINSLRLIFSTKTKSATQHNNSNFSLFFFSFSCSSIWSEITSLDRFLFRLSFLLLIFHLVLFYFRLSTIFVLNYRLSTMFVLFKFPDLRRSKLNPLQIKWL